MIHPSYDILVVLVARILPDLLVHGEAHIQVGGLVAEGLHARLAIAALRVDRKQVGPIHGLHHVYHGLHLQVVARHHTHKCLEHFLIAQVPAGGRVPDLRYVEELEQILHVYGHGTARRSDHRQNPILIARLVLIYDLTLLQEDILIVDERVKCGQTRAVIAVRIVRNRVVQVVVSARYGVLYEVDCLLESDRGLPALVAYLEAELDARQNPRPVLVVELVEHVEQGLHPLHTVLIANDATLALGPARQLLILRVVGLLVNGQQSADHQVATLDDFLAFVGHGGGRRVAQFDDQSEPCECARG